MELGWTRHLADHLESDRDGKYSIVFALVSLLELAGISPAATEGELAASLQN